MSLTVKENRYSIIITEHYNTLGIDFPDDVQSENRVLFNGNQVVNNGDIVIHTPPVASNNVLFNGNQVVSDGNNVIYTV